MLTELCWGSFPSGQITYFLFHCLQGSWSVLFIVLGFFFAEILTLSSICLILPKQLTDTNSGKMILKQLLEYI